MTRGIRRTDVTRALSFVFFKNRKHSISAEAEIFFLLSTNSNLTHYNSVRIVVHECVKTKCPPTLSLFHMMS